MEVRQNELTALLGTLYTTHQGEVRKVLKVLQAELDDFSPHKEQLGESYITFCRTFLLAQLKFAVMFANNISRTASFAGNIAYAKEQLRRVSRLLDEHQSEIFPHPPTQLAEQQEFYFLAQQLLLNPHLRRTAREVELLEQVMSILGP